MSASKPIEMISSMETYELNFYIKKIVESLGDVTINLTRVSTSKLVDILCEDASADKYDLIFGTALTALLDVRLAPKLASHNTTAKDKLDAKFADADGLWFAPSAYSVAVCVDREKLKSRSIDPPTSWSDMCKPEFHGEIVAPHPASSGAAYLQVFSMLQVMGEADGWKMLEALNHNVVEYTASGLAPCHAVADGKSALGVSVAIAIAHTQAEHANLDMMIPTDKVGCEPEAFALLKKADQNPVVPQILEWALSAEAQDCYRGYSKISLVDQSALQKSAAEGASEAAVPTAVPIDVFKAASIKNSIVAEWNRRIGSSLC